jgi:hypothetical protein
LDRSGSITTSRAAIGEAGTIQTPGSGLVTSTPRRARQAIVISMWGRLGRRSPVCRRVRPLRNRGRGEQKARDELARGGGVDRELAALDRAGALHRERHRAASVVADVDPEAAQRLDRGAHRTPPGLRVAVDPDRPEGEGRDRRQEAHDGPGEAGVDRDAAEQLTGRDEQIGAVVPSPATSVIPTPSCFRASIMRAESRECSGWMSRDGPSASAASTSSRLVRLFEPGSRRRAASGAEATGAGPQGGRRRVVGLGGVAARVQQVGVATGIPKDTHRLTRVYRRAKREDGRHRC